MRTTTTTSLLAGAVILACSQWTVASEIEFESPASPFEHFMSARSGDGPVMCPRTWRVCRKKGGACVKADTCDTVDIPVRCSKDGSCTCCAKDMGNICNMKKPCQEMGGFCVVNHRACTGGGKLLKGQCKCKSWSRRGHCCVPPVPHGHWEYSGKYGPDAWGSLFSTCAGTAQSPIETTAAALDDGALLSYNLKPWVWTNYDVPPNDITVKNNGHSASITWNGFSPSSISGGHLGASYTLAGFHFHWGSDNTKGSEHIIDAASPLELHLVHYKTEYGDVGTAIQHSDGLAVLGILYRIDTALNPQLTPIIDALPSIIEPGTETTVSFGQNLDSLLPTDTTAFMRYSGSLTTPTCNEVVTWTVFTTKSSISEDQMAEFRKLKFVDGSAMVDNFRPPQDLNGRTVTYVKV